MTNNRISINGILVLVMPILMLAASASAAGPWQTVYTEDFSADPGWTTNNPSRHYWDPSTETYFVNAVTVNYGGYYAYHDVGHDGSSFRLEMDMKVTDTEYPSALTFGLFDSDMEVPGGPSASNSIIFKFMREDRGHTTGLNYANSDGEQDGDEGNLAQYSLNTWYHIRMEYDADAETLIADITEGMGGAGDPFNYISLADVGSFSNDMGRIGSSLFRNGTFQSPGAEMSGNIDNVAFSVPEPMSVVSLMIGLGMVGGLRKRRLAVNP